MGYEVAQWEHGNEEQLHGLASLIYDLVEYVRALFTRREVRRTPHDPCKVS